MKVSQLVGRRKIDLNVDIGEGFDLDDQLLDFATSANVCCGVHAGSEELTKEIVARCRSKQVRVGIHPGYPDRASAGRAGMESGQEREYLKSVHDQVEWFKISLGADYLKPHGGFYNDTGRVLPDGWERTMRTNPISTVYETGGIYLSQFPGIQSLTLLLRIHRLDLMGLPGTAHEVIAQRAGQRLIREGFADRRYAPEGTLVPRSQPGAVLASPDEVRDQVERLAPKVDSICLHGDTKDALIFAELVVKCLSDLGFGIGS